MDVLCILATSLLLLAQEVTSERRDFTGHRLVSVSARSRAQVELLQSLESETGYDELDFWSDPSLFRPTDILVSPSDFGKLRTFLNEHNMVYQIKNENIQAAIDAEYVEVSKQSKLSSCPFTSTYCTYDQIQSFLLALQSAYPTKVKVTNIGTTYEGRNIYAVKVSENLSQPKAKSVWVEAGTHAREWIAIASALNLIDKLLTASRTESSTMLRAYDWNIVPVHNPDGYAYSHSNSRLHRKNRQVESRPCYFSNYGIDLNRNWDADFGKAGTTTQCQGDTYPGMSAFAARETTALRNAVLSDMPNVEAFFSVHCYSELMLLPHGFNNTKPADYAHLFSVAEHMMRWLETVRGTYYLSGTPPEILYSASGGAYDYFKLQGLKYAYTYELSPSSSTGNGFVLSATHIPAVSEELFMSLWAFVDIVTK